MTPDMMKEVAHDAKMSTTREAHELGEFANGKLEAREGVEQPEEAADTDRVLEAKLLLELAHSTVVGRLIGFSENGVSGQGRSVAALVGSGRRHNAVVGKEPKAHRGGIPRLIERDVEVGVLGDASL